MYLGPCRGPHIRVTFLLSFTIGTWGVWRYLHLTDRKGARILVELDCNRASLLPGLVVLESPLGLSGAWFSRGHRSTSLVSLSACKWALILPEPFDSAEDGCERGQGVLLCSRFSLLFCPLLSTGVKIGPPSSCGARTSGVHLGGHYQ